MASEAPGCGGHVGLAGDSWTEPECPQPWRNFSLAKSVTGLLLRAFQMARAPAWSCLQSQACP